MPFVILMRRWNLENTFLVFPQLVNLKKETILFRVTYGSRFQVISSPNLIILLCHIWHFKIYRMRLFLSPFDMINLVVQKNVVFCIVWYFGLKCHTIKVFQRNIQFLCKWPFCKHNEDTYNEIIFLLMNYAHDVTCYGVNKI